MRGNLHDNRDAVSRPVRRALSTERITPVSGRLHTSRIQAARCRTGTVGRYHLPARRLR